jgi:hypothetical protein
MDRLKVYNATQMADIDEAAQKPPAPPRKRSPR